MRRLSLLSLLGLFAMAGCSPYLDPPQPPPQVTLAQPPPITGTVVVQPQP